MLSTSTRRHLKQDMSPSVVTLLRLLSRYDSREVVKFIAPKSAHITDDKIHEHGMKIQWVDILQTFNNQVGNGTSDGVRMCSESFGEIRLLTFKSPSQRLPQSLKRLWLTRTSRSFHFQDIFHSHI